jgi:DNA-binding IclR family transcriptional regulator
MSGSIREKPKTPQRRPGGVDVLDRAFSILFSFKANDPALTLAQLSARTGLYKSTLLRLACSLVYHRFLVRLEDGRYRLGPAGLTLGSIYQSNLNIGDVLLPLMRDLNRELGEAISFHVREGNVRVCLFRISTTYSIGPQVRVGDVQSLDRGAGGRVLLAFTDEPGEPYETVRRTYCFMSLGDRDPETAGISAPVFGSNQRLIGALGIVGPVSRVDMSYMEDVKGRLLHAAALATEALGGDPSPLLKAAVDGATVGRKKQTDKS